MILSDYLAAAAHGAAAIYHEAVAVEQVVHKWTEDHPEIAPLLNTGVSIAASLLVKAGGPAAVAAGDVLIAMRAIAARDSTLNSVPVTTAG